jgi:hypothetical protein
MSARTSGPPGLPRLLAGLDQRGAAMSLAEHRQVHGPLPNCTPQELIEAAEAPTSRRRPSSARLPSEPGVQRC